MRIIPWPSNNLERKKKQISTNSKAFIVGNYFILMKLCVQNSYLNNVGFAYNK